MMINEDPESAAATAPRPQARPNPRPPARPVPIYRGLPLQVGGLELNGLYLQTTTPLSSVAPSVLTRIERHDLHRKAALSAAAIVLHFRGL